MTPGRPFSIVLEPQVELLKQARIQDLLARDLAVHADRVEVDRGDARAVGDVCGMVRPSDQPIVPRRAVTAMNLGPPAEGIEHLINARRKPCDVVEPLIVESIRLNRKPPPSRKPEGFMPREVLGRLAARVKASHRRSAPCQFL